MDVRPLGLTALDASEELLQSGFWGAFKQEHGWKAHAFEVSVGAETRFGLLVLTRSLARLFAIAYVPFGPAHDPVTGRAAFLSGLSRALRGRLPRNTLFIRYDLPWRKAAASAGAAGEEPGGGSRPRLVKAGADMQPPDTVIVDLAPPLETVLGSMKSKTRYNIRLAVKKGVAVREGAVGDLDRWYALYEETSRRDRIAIHARRYYEGLLKAPASYDGMSPRVSLLFAWHENDLLAGNIVVFWRRQAVYLYGASSGVKRNLMPTYALQWEAMRLAREAGCTSYDFFGVPPRPDPGHPMFGLYQFKTGFNNQVTERWGTWDAPFRSALYRGYRAAEALRMFYYRNVKKRFRTRSGGNASQPADQS